MGQVSHGTDVLVAAAREVDQNALIAAHGFGQLHGVGYGVGGFQRRNDAFGAAQVVEGFQGFCIGNADIFGASDVFQKCVFGAHAGVVQPCADAVRLGNLPVFVLQDISAVAV